MLKVRLRNFNVKKVIELSDYEFYFVNKNLNHSFLICDKLRLAVSGIQRYNCISPFNTRSVAE